MRFALLAASAAALLVAAPGVLSPAPHDKLLEALVLDSAVCSPQEGLQRRDALGALLAGAQAYAQTTPAAKANGPPPLMQGLGNASLPIRTSNAAAQAYFNQGLNMLHGFNHAEAARAFRHAQTLDPQCAMCFWGEAFALGPNINAAMQESDNPAAYQAARNALNRSAGVSPIEQALIEAMALRYARDWTPDRSALDGAFADAMSNAAQRFPDNDLVQILSAEADMDTQPWDYWAPGGRAPKGRAAHAIERIEKVLARSPENAGAIHLYIHLAEASTDPWRAEQAAERLDKVAPNAGHLVHMPGHIYYRVGRFKDSIRQNIIAADVDARYIKSAQASPTYQYGYYTHNLHFVVASAQRGGDAKTALEYADRLDQALPMDMAAKVAMAQPVKIAVWLARADFEEPAKLLARPEPGAGVDFVTASWRYARAMAHLRAGRIAESRAEASKLADVTRTGNFDMMTRSGVPAADILTVYARVLEGKTLMAENRTDEAIRALEQAASLQDTIPYTEPPFIHYPVRRTLGAAYIEAKRYGLAEQSFVQVLLNNAGDAYAYWGIAEARRQRGDKAGARAAGELFKAAWLGKGAKLALRDL